MQMENQQLKRLISNSILGLLSIEEEKELQQYLKDQPQIQQKLEELRSSFPEDYEKFINYRGERIEHILKESQKAKIRKVAVYMAAAIALLLVILTFTLNPWEEKTVPPVLSEEMQQTILLSKQSNRQDATITTIDDEKEYHEVFKTEEAESLNADMLLNSCKVTTYHDKEFWLTLDDGTVVHINNDTRLIYPQKFSNKKREVYLEGEAYFAVAKNSHHPFVVHTPQGSIIVHGTEFNVNTNNEYQQTEVILVKGSVSIKPTHGEEMLLKPNEMAHMKQDGASIETVDIEPYIAWNTGTFDFRDVELEKIMNVLGQWHSKKVLFQSDSLRQKTFYGSIRRYDDIRPAIKAIEGATNIHIELNDQTIIISE